MPYGQSIRQTDFFISYKYTALTSIDVDTQVNSFLFSRTFSTCTKSPVRCFVQCTTSPAARTNVLFSLRESLLNNSQLGVCLSRGRSHFLYSLTLNKFKNSFIEIYFCPSTLIELFSLDHLLHSSLLVKDTADGSKGAPREDIAHYARQTWTRMKNYPFITT